MTCINVDTCRNREARYYTRISTTTWVLRYCGVCAGKYDKLARELREEIKGTFDCYMFLETP